MCTAIAAQEQLCSESVLNKPEATAKRGLADIKGLRRLPQAPVL
jgi:hypothetical protein